MNEILKDDPMIISMSLNKINLHQYKVFGYLNTKIEVYREDSKRIQMVESKCLMKRILIQF
ncbi:unnamed protein product [Paramecium sonneborni]|uniref:Uncharacterized protein n=1 Tax=Paramecium sonneborni TaxID=65129 RepID=A0A8S1QSF0_9CILI|nr:unnamed protein product [Paramecium sonneborni]